MSALRWSHRTASSVTLAVLVAAFIAGCKPKEVIKEVPTETGAVVTLASTEVNPTPPSAKISKTQSSDHVRWVNTTTQTITLKFTSGGPSPSRRPTS